MTKVKTVNHKRLQQYEHHYGMVCLTGTLGCRWHRYQQSKAKSSKCDICWYVGLLLVSLACVFWFYFWLLAANSSDNFNWYIFQQLGKWKPYYQITFILVCTTFSYLLLLNIISLCHVGYHHQVHIHWTHRVVLVLILVMCVVAVIVICELWPLIWGLQVHSLMITGPFLHLSAVSLMTVMTWFIAGYWIALYRTVSRVLYLGFYISVMLFLYVVPVMINSPCIGESADLPTRPGLIGHRGSPQNRPENTEYSFTTSLDYVMVMESDVQISSDGVPFLLHDGTFRRTTDIKDVFPEYVDIAACGYNISSIEQLNAGAWFLKADPFGKAGSLTDPEKSQCRNQSIPRLSWLLAQAKRAGVGVMFDVKTCSGHPYSDRATEVILEVIRASGIDPKQIWWLVNGGDNPDPATSNLTLTYRVGEQEVAPPVGDLTRLGVAWVNAEVGKLGQGDVRSYQSAGIRTIIYTVNSDWLYSLYWCMGVDAVTTDRAGPLSRVNKPVWALTPRQFRAMWITTDVVSVALVILIFIVQHLRRYGKSLSKTINSERLSLQGAKIRMSHVRKNRNMREKLLHTVEGLQEVDPGILGLSSENIDTDFTENNMSINSGSTAMAVNGSSVINGSAVNVNGSSVNGSSVNMNTSVVNGLSATGNRLSTASGWSGISGISAISGTGVGDSSFSSMTGAPPGEEPSYQRSEIPAEIPEENPTV